MDQYWRARSSTTLLAFTALALAYAGLLLTYDDLTGDVRLDGVIGVVLGLYICSHPASNMLDLLFADGGATRRTVADQHGIPWYALNLLVLVAGWSVVFLGLTRFMT